MLEDVVLELHNVTVMSQERADGWVVKMPEFALTAYGATEHEAESKVQEGLDFLLKSYATEEGLREYLDWSGVVYRLVPRRQPKVQLGKYWFRKQAPVMSIELAHK